MTLLYAHAGEAIVCDAGHVVTRPVRDIALGEAVFGEMLEGMSHLRAPSPAEGIEGDAFPPCSCGAAWWWWGGILRFRDGYRVVRDGTIGYLSSDEVPFWPDEIDDGPHIGASA